MGKQRPCLAGLMAVIGVVALYRGKLRPWMYTWGADDDEVDGRALRRDELVAATASRTTRAVTIDAPMCAVWPWLAQIGEDRGGFYSYSLLERAVGRISTTRTPFTRNGRTCASGTRCGWPGGTARRPGRWSPRSIRSPIGVDVARRLRAGAAGREGLGCLGILFAPRKMDGPGWSFAAAVAPSGTLVFDIPHFVMEQKMMRGIRDRAQETYRTAGQG